MNNATITPIEILLLEKSHAKVTALIKENLDLKMEIALLKAQVDLSAHERAYKEKAYKFFGRRK